MRVLHARSLSLSLHYLFTKYLSATMAFLLRPCRLMTQLLWARPTLLSYIRRAFCEINPHTRAFASSLRPARALSHSLSIMDLQLQLVLCDCVIINCQLLQEITGLIRNAHVMRRGMRRKIGMELPNCYTYLALLFCWWHNLEGQCFCPKFLEFRLPVFWFKGSATGNSPWQLKFHQFS
jgi:hypothetical protein